MLRRRFLALPVLAAAPPVLAETEAPRGRPILQVTGRIGAAEGVRFDLVALEALGRADLVTRTAWTGDAPRRFAGVPLARLLQHVGAQGQMLRAVALNDYAITAPVPELLQHGAFLATREDDQPLRIRDRGPVWMIFPWSQRPELDVALVRERSIWQLRAITIA
ncbi:hypothetical protein DFH01_18110 [Falsiroseomonas bella]|uniref:Oxidoreductase molybdopterin-binding domain-containing protein n=1 Tax=Falsiroseomonas bella TaxID=2184016 RepID=A0A317FD86_9PROT|nr:molybdopterin-dependent oxidoreductase [Falsiroseomonas bella]PWS35518.1 hypothetical protein DFH01_18110 [Falsiroseomonas bella]